MQTFSKEKEIYLGYAEASTGLGITFGPIIGSIIFRFLGYEYCFYSNAILSSIMVVICVLFMPKKLNNIG